MKNSNHNLRKNRFTSILLLAAVLFTGFLSAQELVKPMSLITVNGEGKVKVIPDQVMMSVSVENKGNNAADVKRMNDESVEKVLQTIRKANIPKEDVVTQRVALNPQYDYDKKKYNYVATQTIEILLKDITKYETVMAGIVDSGINRINKVEFKSSKLEQHQSEARKLAMQDAKHKADDFVSVLAQKVGRAFTINDNTQVIFPQPMYYAMEAKAADSEVRDTLAIGEINIVANVMVSFELN